MDESETVGSRPRSVEPRRRPRWRRSLSLRALMGLVLLVGSGLGLLANRLSNRARAVATIRELGGKLSFRDEDVTEAGPWIYLYRWTGAESCREVVQVSYQGPAADASLAGPSTAGPPIVRQLAQAIAQLPEAGRVVFQNCPVALSDLAPLAGMSIETLHLNQLRALIDDRPGGATPFPRLKHFLVGLAGGGELPRSLLATIGEMPALERLYVASPLGPLGGTDLAPLARLRSLTLLDLGRTAIDESALATLDEMPQLQAIWARRCRTGDATLARVVARHPDLVSIEVDGSALTDSGVASLAESPKLVMVILRGTPEAPGHLTDASLIALGRIATLRRLVVTCGHFGAAGLDGLRGRKFLRLALRSIEPGSTPALVRLVAGQQFEWLRLGGPGVADDLLPHLAPSLIPRRAILELTDSAITDAGLAHLAPLPIFELVLNRTAIDDAGLATLAGPLGPRGLYLRDTKATAAGLAAFEAAHPGVARPPGEVLDDD